MSADKYAVDENPVAPTDEELVAIGVGRLAPLQAAREMHGSVCHDRGRGMLRTI